MKNIIAYESFKGLKNKIMNSLNKDDDRIFNANFTYNESDYLFKFGFKRDKLTKDYDKLIYNSPSSDINIEIRKYYNEVVIGYVINIYELKLNDELISVKDFSDLLQKIKDIIPIIDNDVNKYNL